MAKEISTIIQSVDRALKLIDYIAFLPEGRHNLTELSREMELDKSSIFRILTTLSNHDLIQQEEDKKNYRLGFGVFKLASTLYEQMKIPKIVSPYLKEIAYKTKENAHLAVRSGTKAVFIDREQGTSLISTSTHIGDSEELYCSAVGKSLICDFTLENLQILFDKYPLEKYTENTIMDLETLFIELQNVKKSGYAVDFEEYETNVVCVSTPLFDYRGSIIAAIGVSGPKDRAISTMDLNKELLLNAAADINYLLGKIEHKGQA